MNGTEFIWVNIVNAPFNMAHVQVKDRIMRYGCGRWRTPHQCAMIVINIVSSMRVRVPRTLKDNECKTIFVVCQVMIGIFCCIAGSDELYRIYIF